MTHMTQFAAPIAEELRDMKYRFKKSDGTPIDVTVEDTWWRVANALSAMKKNSHIGQKSSIQF